MKSLQPNQSYNIFLEMADNKILLLGDAAIAAGIKSGNINIAGAMKTEVMDLSEESKDSMLQHAEKLRKFEAHQRARAIIVPTAIEDIKKKLREFGHPVTLFGENHADRRERLREVIAGLELSEEELTKTQALLNQSAKAIGTSNVSATGELQKYSASASQKEVFYSPASDALISARKVICEYSCNKSCDRILGTKRVRASETLQAEEDRVAAALYLNSKEMVLDSSQFGDDRPVTAVRYCPAGNYFATGSLSSGVKLWYSDSLCQKGVLRGHIERITGLAWHPEAFLASDTAALLATSSADGVCGLWDCRPISDEGGSVDGLSSHTFLRKLTGHQGVVTDCAFHPCGRYLGTSGVDCTWRLWDVETGSELLLQDGHIKEVGALAFQGDGSLVLTADWAGVALLWDLRSGKTVHAFQGHIKKIVTASFSPNGFQVATGAADHMVRIWDIRKKKCGYCLPGHSNLISSVQYSASGEILVTSSFDGTVKVWSGRDFEPLRSLSGHSGKVMSCDVSPDEKTVVSVGYDRTIKKWVHKSSL